MEHLGDVDHLMKSEIVKDFMDEAQDDIVGLWEVINEARDRLGASAAGLKGASLEIVGLMLEAGFVAGDPPYSAGGYRPWPVQDRAYVLDRIDREWQALGREPNIPDIAWFDFPEVRRGQGQASSPPDGTEA